MADDDKSTTIEVTLPLALVRRVRALESNLGRSDESIVGESLRTYFAERALVHEA